MDTYVFDSFVREFCEASGLRDIEGVRAGHEFGVGCILASLKYDPAFAVDWFLVRCAIVTVQPTFPIAKLLKGVLAENFRNGGSFRSAVFSMDPCSPRTLVLTTPQRMDATLSGTGFVKNMAIIESIALDLISSSVDAVRVDS